MLHRGNYIVNTSTTRSPCIIAISLSVKEIRMLKNGNHCAL